MKQFLEIYVTSFYAYELRAAHKQCDKSKTARSHQRLLSGWCVFPPKFQLALASRKSCQVACHHVFAESRNLVLCCYTCASHTQALQ